MKNKEIALFAALGLASAIPGSATSARTIHPQLVGVKTVALNLSSDNLPGLDVDQLEKDIRARLDKAGMTVDPSAPIVLFARISYQHLPACPDFVAFRTSVALSEDVNVRRGSRTESVYVDTWQENQESVEHSSKAGALAQQSALALIEHLIDSAEYSTSVAEKQR